MEAFYDFDLCNMSDQQSPPQSLNVANNIISAPQNSTLYRQSAFGLYFRPYTHFLYVKNGRENPTKKCFEFFRKNYENRREVQRLSQAAYIQGQHEYSASLQNKAAFHHMITERNRRVQLKKQFSSLHSLLPHNTKRDKFSVLSTTLKYISDLKRRVSELQRRNCALEELFRISISNKEGCSSFDQRHEEHQATLIYSSDEVVLEQSKKIPNQVDMRINVQINPLSSPTDLIIVLLERLKEVQLEVVLVQSNVQIFKLEAHLLLTQIKGDEWDNSKWKDVAELVRRTFV